MTIKPKKEKITKGYKAFEKDWTCNGFKFEVGKTYEIKEDPVLCKRGFHFCKQGVDVLNFYPDFANQKYAKIEAYGKTITEKDKTVCRKIKIMEEVTKEEIIRAFRASKKASTTGYSAHASTTGVRAHASTTGDNAHASTTGDNAHASTTGDNAHASTTGVRAHASTTGYSAHASTTGEQSISCALNIFSKARAVKGWIVLVNWINNSIEGIYTAKIGQSIKGKIIRPDVWYWFEQGELKEQEEK